VASRGSQRCRGAENPQNSRDLDTNKDYDTGGTGTPCYPPRGPLSGAPLDWVRFNLTLISILSDKRQICLTLGWT